MQKVKQIFTTILILGTIFLINNFLFAWTAPTEAPPSGNVPAPINTSATEQYKSGAFGVGGAFRAYSGIKFDNFQNCTLTTDGTGLVQCGGFLPRSYLSGLQISNSAGDLEHDINISVGEGKDFSNNVDIKLSSNMVKRLDASWSAGSGNGGLFSGTIAANTWYHVFVIKNNSTGAVDAGFDTSVNAANIPASFSSYRRIGSILTDRNSNVYGFKQYGDEFMWDSIKVGGRTTAYGRGQFVINIHVPPGVLVKAIGVGDAYGSYTIPEPQHARGFIYSPLLEDQSYSGAGDGRANVWSAGDWHNYASGSFQLDILTNTGQLKVVIHSGGSVGFATHGWIDSRGKDN